MGYVVPKLAQSGQPKCHFALAGIWRRSLVDARLWSHKNAQWIGLCKRFRSFVHFPRPNALLDGPDGCKRIRADCAGSL